MKPPEQGTVAAPGRPSGVLEHLARGGHAMIRGVLREHTGRGQTREQYRQPRIHPQQGQRDGDKAGKGRQESGQLPNRHAAESGKARILVQAAGPYDAVRYSGARIGQAAGQQNDAPRAMLLVVPAKADRADAYLVTKEGGADQQYDAGADAQEDEFGALGRQESHAGYGDRRVFRQRPDAEIDRAHCSELQSDVRELARDHRQHFPAGHAEEVPHQPTRGLRILRCALQVLTELALRLGDEVAIDAD